MEADGKTPNEDYLDMFLESIRTHRNRFDDPERRENNLEYDLLTTDWILEKVRASEVYAQHLYAAMCNNSFLKLEVLPILTDTTWSCSWRYAGGIIADMRQQGDYIDWYCSGIRNHDDDSKFVPECVVTDEIRADLLKLDWKVIDEDSLLV
jgi:hypothetical protein